MNELRVRGPAFRGLAALCLFLAAAVGFVAPAGGQEAPAEEDAAFLLEPLLAQYGWWNKFQQAPAGSSPVPKPPRAPDDGLYIAQEYQSVPGSVPVAGPSITGAVGGASGAVPPPTLPPGTPAGQPVPPNTPTPAEQVLVPTAFGAIRYVVPDGADSEVTLKLKDKTATTPGGVDPLVGAMTACLAVPPWEGIQNARFDQAPSYDCTAAASGVIAGDTVTFSLPPTFVNAGTLDFVILPSGPQPFQVGLLAPTDQSIIVLNLAELAELQGIGGDDFGFEDPLADVIEAGGFEDIQALEDIDFSDTTYATSDFSAGGTTTRITRRAGAPPRTRIATPTASIGNPFRPDASRAERAMAVGMLLAMGAALWWLGGQPVRAPRLLGSLGGGNAAAVPTADGKSRGIGRFARPRNEGKAPRLF